MINLCDDLYKYIFDFLDKNHLISLILTNTNYNNIYINTPIIHPSFEYIIQSFSNIKFVQSLGWKCPLKKYQEFINIFELKLSSINSIPNGNEFTEILLNDLIKNDYHYDNLWKNEPSNKLLLNLLLSLLYNADPITIAWKHWWCRFLSHYSRRSYIYIWDIKTNSIKKTNIKKIYTSWIHADPYYDDSIFTVIGNKTDAINAINDLFNGKKKWSKNIINKYYK